MKKRVYSESSGKSLKTFFLFSGIVVTLIALSLMAKLWYIILQSKYDPGHNFTVVLSKNNKVEQIYGFNPSSHSVSVLKIQGREVPVKDAAKIIAIPFDSKISFAESVDDARVVDTLSKAIFNYAFIKTNLTLFDMGRLYWAAHNVSDNNIKKKEVVIPVTDSQLDKVVKGLFTDEALLSENVSVQIVNASDIPGMGKRLERVLSNIGGNIVSVITSRNPEKSSRIEYAGDKSYTLQKIGRIFNFPIIKSNNQGIANIVIVIGKDSEKTQSF